MCGNLANVENVPWTRELIHIVYLLLIRDDNSYKQMVLCLGN